jgi:hypothetical protein
LIYANCQASASTPLVRSTISVEINSWACERIDYKIRFFFLKDARRRGVFFRMFSKGKLEESLVREFGDYLKEKRVKANLSQAEVAEELGYSSPQFVSNFERGLCTPPLSALKQMLSLYNISKKEMVELLVRQERKHIELALSTSGKGSKKVH